MKKLIAILFAFVLMLGCTALADSGNYQFIQAEDGIYLSGYEGTDTVLHLPGEHEGQSVVGISEGAFSGNTAIVEVYIPDSYRTIGAEAFSGCTSLRDVYLGSGIALIDARAFSGCGSLLSVSIVQYDFYEDPTAFDGEETRYNGADINYYRQNNNGEDYDWLYIAACDMMSRGNFEEARDIFLSLYGYELSSDYYFYCCGRIYEQRGDIDAALAVYALIPDLNDCHARLDYYGGSPEVVTFFTGDSYSEYYNEYFGEGGSYAAWLSPEEAEETVAIIGGADGPTSIIVAEEDGEEDGESSVGNVIGSLLNSQTSEPQVEATVEPTAEPTPEPVEENPALMAYHDFAGIMPYSYDDRSASEGYFSIYYLTTDFEPVFEYVELFESQGWVTMNEADPDGWQYIYVINDDTSAYFMISYCEADEMLVFMYESNLPFGFDPANGL